ncbi:family 65 glycosyl hydrolase [Fischerella thermalis CCMEE 5330]|uniref:Family 65 glycosyl hydrolase n=1 Tax=Fischerella thermalis CCMEE 5330 TaxID=2019670 RepID=A0A2N6MNM3_9CYAN|nr:family 65 glycosyl hydrolase [Fischerella thermalis CCMEE 5330]
MRIQHMHTTPIYPLDPWQIIETEATRAEFARNATLFALANGTLGVRGALDDNEGDAAGTFINGFYESAPIHYPENAYGFARESQTMLKVVEAAEVRLQINGEWVSPTQLAAHRRTLDMQAGTLTTEQTISAGGQTLVYRSVRLVAQSEPALFVQSITVTSEDFSGEVKLWSRVNADTRLKKVSDDPRVGSHLQGQIFDISKQPLDAHTIEFEQATRRSEMALACAVTHISTPLVVPDHPDDLPTEETFIYAYTLQPGETIRLDKYASYATTLQHPRDYLQSAATQGLQSALAQGVEALIKRQQDDWAAFWHLADVRIDGDDALQQGIRFNLFHLYQSVGRDGRTNIGAKGLTGEGYEGHTFWDTEMYVIPALVHTMPMIVRQLLTYRYNILDRARQRARELGHKKGASFAWRTINGDECSAYFPAGSAQYHINADIAYAVQRYVTVTGDTEFMQTMGAEILIETARLWMDIGGYIDGRGFCICEVTGPDEYTALVNNNAFTNWMAQANLRYAVQAVEALKADAPEVYEALRNRLSLLDDEPAQWAQAADQMFIPYDAARDLYAQDDSFFHKPVWDFANTPAENYPLLLHYHPMVIYRHQVCKQADLVLALYLLGDQFTTEQKRRHFDYYEAVTTHDSSLSACIFGIVAADIGDMPTAYEYFIATARMDLDDTHRNVKDGVHIANMAGTWKCVVNGFGGLRVYKDKLRLRPRLPELWQGYAFNVFFRGAMLRVEVDAHGTTYTLLQDERLTFAHGEQEVTVQAGQPLRLPHSAL